MNRSTMILATISAAAVSALLATSLARSQAPAAQTGAPRYTADLTVVGGLAAVLTVTDHLEQKVHLYSLEKESVELKQTIDLAKAGQPKLDFVLAANPTTQPMK